MFGNLALGLGVQPAPFLAQFDPASLFASSEKGFVFDFTDPATLFQNAAGTVAAASNADPIGYARDLSGCGNHATQPTDSRRPLFKTGENRADFNASRLITPSINLTGGNKFTLLVALRNIGSVTAIVVESSDNINTTGRAGSLQVSLGTLGAFSVGGRADSSPRNRTSQNINRPYERLVETTWDFPQATLAEEVGCWIDGVPGEMTDGPGPLGGGNLGNWPFNIGARQNDTVPMQGAIYRIFGINRLLTPLERVQVQAWVGAPIHFVPIELLTAGAPGVEHLISYGQSLSVGVGTGAVRLTSQPNDSLMFVGGVRAQDGGSEPWIQHGGLVPLVEAQGPAAAGGDRYETPLSGAALMSKQLNLAYQFLGSAPGQGSVTISALSKDGTLYQRLMDDVRYGKYQAKLNRKSYKARSFFWMQGEADGANDSYSANLNTLRTNISADIRAITGQPEDVWCISYQLDRPKIGLAHLAASDTYSRIRVAFPLYFLARTDGVHLTPAASDIAGAYFALARERIVDQGNTSWQPLRCTAHAVAGAVIDLTYNPVGGLAFDTATVAAQTNQGFRLFDSGGNPLTISSVAIVGADKVRITAAANVPAGAVVRYGFSDPADHTANVSKGNLRDSQGDEIVFAGAGLNYPMHNWAVMEQVTL